MSRNGDNGDIPEFLSGGGEMGARMRAHDWSATPLFVNNTVYVSTPLYRVFAIEPDTGKVKWIFAAKTISNDPKSEFHGKNRGMAPPRR